MRAKVKGISADLIFVASLLAACSQPDETTPLPPDPCREDARYEPTYGTEEDLTFYVGPYLGHTTTTSVAVAWETALPGESRLDYGLDDGYGQSVAAGSGTMHQVVVEDLEPDTTYHYRACTGDDCTVDLTFATAPSAGRPTRLAVYGDCQDNPDIHHSVVEQVIGDAPNLALVTGDLVGDGSIREQYKERFFDPARLLSHYVPRYAAIGNHDRKDVQGVNFRDYLMFPEDPDAPQTEVSYSFVYGDAFYLVLDNTMDHLDLFFPMGDWEPPLWLWLKKVVASPEARAARWRFAFAHYPADASCREDDYEYGNPDRAMREHVLPLLWDHGFQAYFSGHIHCYERLDFDGRLVIITGGGGGDPDPQERCDSDLPEARVQQCVHHHVTVELGCEQAEVWARDVDGNIIDRVLLNRDGSHEAVGE